MYDKIEDILTELEKVGSLLGFMGDYFRHVEPDVNLLLVRYQVIHIYGVLLMTSS